MSDEVIEPGQIPHEEWLKMATMIGDREETGTSGPTPAFTAANSPSLPEIREETRPPSPEEFVFAELQPSSGEGASPFPFQSPRGEPHNANPWIEDSETPVPATDGMALEPREADIATVSLEEVIVRNIEQMAEIIQPPAGNGEGDLAGWFGNIVHVLVRDGGITFVTTAVRELIGMAAAKHFDDMPQERKVVASSLILGGIGLMTLGGLIRQERNGQGNVLTRSSRATTLAALASFAGGAAWKGVLGDTAPQLIKVAAYAGTRDSLNLFFKLNDNREKIRPTNKKAVFADMLGYSMNQMIVNMIQTLPNVQSGTGREAVEGTYRALFPNILKFSAANGFGEFLDTVLYTGLTALFDPDLPARPADVERGLPEGQKGTYDGLKNLRLRMSVGTPSQAEFVSKIHDAMMPRMAVFSLLFVIVNFIVAAEEDYINNLSETNRTMLVNGVAALAIGVLLPTMLFASATVSRSER